VVALIHEPFDHAALTAASDLDLDHGLARLYLLHAEAQADERALIHPRIMQILEEQAARRDVWLADHG
jgi:hypothetical protein